MTLLFHDIHFTVDPAVVLSALTLASGVLGVLRHRRNTRRK